MTTLVAARLVGSSLELFVWESIGCSQPSLTKQAVHGNVVVGDVDLLRVFTHDFWTMLRAKFEIGVSCNPIITDWKGASVNGEVKVVDGIGVGVGVLVPRCWEVEAAKQSPWFVFGCAGEVCALALTFLLAVLFRRAGPFTQPCQDEVSMAALPFNCPSKVLVEQNCSVMEALGVNQ
jgi:hypothetical protein